MKKLSKLLLTATTLSLFLTACGGTTNVVDNTEENKLITVWAMGEEGKQMGDFITSFEEESGYDVEVQAIPWGEAHNKLLAAVASKEGPDVIQLGTTWMTEFSEADTLVDLTEYIDDYSNFNSSNFFEGSFDTCVYEDGVYGIPFFADTRLLYYRTDILAELGYNEPPKTWEELKEYSEKLSARGENFYGMNWDTNEQSLTFMLANQLGSKYYGRTPELEFNTPEFIEATAYINSFFEDGEVPYGLNVDVTQGFADGQYVPMFVSGPWMINIINENAPEISGKWATAVLPSGAVNNDSILGGTNLTVFKHGKNIDGALEFINYMVDKDVQSNWYETTSTLPANINTWEENNTLKEDELISVFGDQLQNAKSMPMVPEFEKIAQTWLGEFEKIYVANEDVETIVAGFDETVKEILK